MSDLNNLTEAILAILFLLIFIIVVIAIVYRIVCLIKFVVKSIVNERERPKRPEIFVIRDAYELCSVIQKIRAYVIFPDN